MINYGLIFVTDGVAAAGKPAATVTIPKQPRVVFSEVELRELAESMRANGQIQAIAVEAAPRETYILIDGERRWRLRQVYGRFARLSK